MSPEIEPASPRDPEITQLLRQSHALMLSLFDKEACHFMDIDALCVPEITLFAARIGGVAQGCVALRRCDGYGEVKSMFVDPAARGQGIARALLRHLVQVAQDEGLGVLRLETGTGLDAAQALYRDEGFAQTGPFGGYVAADTSLFFARAL